MASSTASLNHLGIDPLSHPADHLTLFVLGLAADLCRKVPSPAMIKPGQLG
jgi:hypothetical protein